MTWTRRFALLPTLRRPVATPFVKPSRPSRYGTCAKFLGAEFTGRRMFETVENAAEQFGESSKTPTSMTAPQSADRR